LVGFGGCSFASFWLNQAWIEEINKASTEHDESEAKTAASGLHAKIPNHLQRSHHRNNRLSDLSDYFPLAAIIFGSSLSIIAFNSCPSTVASLWKKLEPGAYYGMASLLGITGLSIIQDCSIVDLCSKATGAWLIGFALESMIPTKIFAVWKDRTSNVLNIFSVLSSAGLLALGWSMLKFKNPKIKARARQCFGGGLVIGGLFYAAPQSLRNGVLK
jgi:hypothetical protein